MKPDTRQANDALKIKQLKSKSLTQRLIAKYDLLDRSYVDDLLRRPHGRVIITLEEYIDLVFQYWDYSIDHGKLLKEPHEPYRIFGYEAAYRNMANRLCYLPDWVFGKTTT